VFEDTQTLTAPPDRSLRLWIEPWGDEREFPRGTVVTLQVRSPHEGRLEVVAADDATWVYGWQGATLEFLVGGGEDVLSFEEQVAVVERHWKEIAARFGADRREETHSRLAALRKGRMGRRFPDSREPRQRDPSNLPQVR
jgi:hypothetical protein